MRHLLAMAIVSQVWAPTTTAEVKLNNANWTAPVGVYDDGTRHDTDKMPGYVLVTKHYYDGSGVMLTSYPPQVPMSGWTFTIREISGPQDAVTYLRRHDISPNSFVGLYRLGDMIPLNHKTITHPKRTRIVDESWTEGVWSIGEKKQP